ncbi:MAG: cytochrome B [Rhodanobacter sp. 68-29]|nr:cytochrome b [Rhodanobacter sp.]ODU74629.1 MAG: cytochrome B [Rhodanobacter sp. SCN 69-32]OJY58157.1 MAG: cytochrome B [Rhodanobacter sp. 68-29]
MNRRHATGRYGSAVIALHWLTVLLLVAVYALIELRGIYPRGSDAHAAMKTWHFVLGLTVLALLPLRLALRAADGAPPPIRPPLPVWQARLAGLVHLALYAFLLAMPVLGWFTLSALGKPVPFFGLELPALIAADDTLGHSLEGIHETIGTLGYWLIGLHAAAALFHHGWMRDNTLRRMLPRRG